MTIKVSKRVRELLAELDAAERKYAEVIGSFNDVTPAWTADALRELNQWKEIRRSELTSVACRLARVASGREERVC